MKGLLDRKNEDVTITRKMPNGASVTYKSPQDSQMDMDGILGGMIDGYTPTPVSDNKTINVTPGEFVVNQPAAQKYKGLLEEINQEGRVALAQGGWTDKPKPMGYANGGPVNFRGQPIRGVAQPQPLPQQQPQLTHEQLNELANNAINTRPEVQVQSLEAPQAQPQPQPPVAEEPPVVDPEAPSGVPSDTQVANTTEASVATQVEGKTDPTTSKAAAKWMGESNSYADATMNLSDKIDKAETKRDSIKMMMFGLSMLNGEGINRSIQAANSVGRYNEQQINDLYSQRKAIQNQLVKPAASSSDEFSQGWIGDDGNVYFSPSEVPQGVTIKGKAGTVDVGDLPARLQGQVNTAQERIDNAKRTLAGIEQIRHYEPEGGWSGIFGFGAKSVQDIFGSQDKANTWRTKVSGLLNQIALADLPPGAASDKDVALVLKGVPSNFANKEQLESFMLGVEKLNDYLIEYNQAQVNYIYDNRGLKGFKGPEFSAGVNPDTAPITSTSNNRDVDLDLSGI